MKTFDRAALPALILAVGLALGAWFVGHGFVRGRTASRYVEVKGLAERGVAADLALWPLRFVTTGDDLAVAQAEITRDTRQVYGFLTRHGVDTSAVQLQRPPPTPARPPSSLPPTHVPRWGISGTRIRAYS